MQIRNVHLTGKRRAGRHRPSCWVPRRHCEYHLYAGGWCWRIVYHPRRGRSAAGVRVRGSTHDFEPVPYLMEDLVKQRVVKAGGGAVGGPVHLAAVETVVLAKFPRLVEHLVTTRYADGAPRKPGMIMVNVLGAAWQVRVTEPDVAAKLTCIADGLDDALALVELHLGSEDAPWEVDPYSQGKGKKK